MKKKQTFEFVIILIITISQSVLAGNRSVSIDGFCFLEGETNHAGTKVLFTAASPSANTDSAYTNSDGSFVMGLSEGIYTVQYSHNGWETYTIPGQIAFFVDTTLDTVILEYEIFEISGAQSGVLSIGYTYHVVGDILVNNGDTLIIGPGVTLKFMGFYSFTIYGMLIAAGTETDSVQFTSGQSAPNSGNWDRIKFESSSDSNSVISYSRIEFASFGIYCDSSSPNISNNSIYNNNNGIQCVNSSPSITNNTICSNNNYGIYCSFSCPIITRNIINYNSRGIHCESSSPTIINNTISTNNDDGIDCQVSSAPTISNNTIDNNTHHGIYCNSSSPIISNNTINDNGDGIYCNWFSSPNISSNTINSNIDGLECLNSSSPTTSNNIFCNNNAGITCINSSYLAILNNIFYNNNYGISANGNASPSSLEWNLFWLNSNTVLGGGIPLSFGEIITVNTNGDSCDTYFNLFMDPLFVAPANGNYHLSWSNFPIPDSTKSPCIDAGNPASPKDPDSTIADIGAFYFHQMVFSQPLLSSWNLIGLPSALNSRYYLDLYPNAIPNTLFGWNGTYQSEDTLNLGNGYWLRFPAPDTARYALYPVDSLHINLISGWNMISGISKPLDLNDVQDPDTLIIPGTLFAFNGVYVSSDSLLPGYGYWLRSSGSGQIVLDANAGGPVLPVRLFKKPDLSGWSTLRITDAAGAEQILYFGRVLNKRESLDRYSLPPLPPAGAFDARFAGDYRLCEANEATIEIQAGCYPLSISAAHLSGGYVLKELAEGEVVETLALTEGRKVRVSNPQVRRLKLVTSEAVPTEFSLRQNYPNPFNPSTTIAYNLPNSSRFTLHIYDVLGRKVKTLLDDYKPAGRYTVKWDGSNDAGQPVASGVYLFRIQAGKFSAVRKMLLAK